MIQKMHPIYRKMTSRLNVDSAMEYEIGKDNPKVAPKNNCGIAKNLFIKGYKIIIGIAI